MLHVRVREYPSVGKKGHVVQEPSRAYENSQKFSHSSLYLQDEPLLSVS